MPINVTDPQTGDVVPTAVVGRAGMNMKALAAGFNGSMMDGCPVERGGQIQAVRIAVGQVKCAAGESAAFTIKKNGVAILTSPVTVDSTAAVGALLDKFATLDTTKAAVAVGDEFTVDCDYTAGGAPARPNISIHLIWG